MEKMRQKNIALLKPCIKKFDEDCRSVRVKLEEKELEFSSRLPEKRALNLKRSLKILIRETEKIKESEAVVEHYKKEHISAKGRF
jgi:hypothetical protein